MKFQATVSDAMRALLLHAQKHRLLLWCEYDSLMLTPDDLKGCMESGAYHKNPEEWQLCNPIVVADALDGEVSFWERRLPEMREEAIRYRKFANGERR